MSNEGQKERSGERRDDKREVKEEARSDGVGEAGPWGNQPEVTGLCTNVR